MLTIVSEALAKTRTLTEVARELSLSPSSFGTAEALDKLLAGHARRIVLLMEDDICEATVVFHQQDFRDETHPASGTKNATSIG